MDFVPEDCKKRLQFWPTFSVFPKAFGSSQVKWGKAVVLLPDYLNVSCVQDMTSVKLNQLLEKEFNWTVPSNQMWLTGAGRLLVDSFIISEKAKKYLIAREMCSTLHNDIYSSGFGVFSWIYVYFLSAAGMQSWFTPPGLVVSFPVFILSQMLSCLVAWSGLYLTETLLHHRNQRNGDALALSRGFKRLHELEELANINRPYSLDPDYYEGALEVYQKEIQRNQSMRHLMMADSQINHCDTFWNRKYVVFRDDGVYRRSSFDPMVSPVDRLNHIKAWKRGRKKPKWAKTFDEIDEATRIQHEEEIRHEKQMQQQREHSQQVPDASWSTYSSRGISLPHLNYTSTTCS